MKTVSPIAALRVIAFTVLILFSVNSSSQNYVCTTLPVKIQGSIFRDGWGDIYGVHNIPNGSCLTSKKVYREVLQQVLDNISQHPSYQIYEVSQADTHDYCTCKNCTTKAKQYGGYSGLNLWFVNKIAKEIAKHYPTKKISTLAYIYTRSAPQNIRPRENVVIRLCDIECCFMHPLEADYCPKNVAFMKDLKDWSKLTKNLYIWDYVTDFDQYLAPYPNIRVLGANIRTFRKYNVIGIFEEGAHNARWSEFSELKHYVIGELLKNPDLDTEELVHQFIFNYYGNAAKDIYSFYQLTQNLVTKDTHRRCYTKQQPDMYSQSYIEESNRLLTSAIRKVKGTELEPRVKRVQAQVLFLRFIVNRDQKAEQELIQILKEDPTRPAESSKDWNEYKQKKNHIYKWSSFAIPTILTIGGIGLCAVAAYHFGHIRPTHAS